jgi:thioredoxin-dependent peroxiredoxin
MIEVGRPAPPFERVAHDGSTVVIGPAMERITVLYFYPKDETAGCVAQACAFRDVYEDFTAAGARVVGVSDDSNTTHREFAEHRRLPFPLVSDTGGQLRTAYGVPNWMVLLRNRVTFVIDRAGIVRMAFESQLRTGTHVERALTMVRELVAG